MACLGGEGYSLWVKTASIYFSADHTEKKGKQTILVTRGGHSSHHSQRISKSRSAEDLNFILEAVQEQGLALEFASTQLRGNVKATSKDNQKRR